MNCIVRTYADDSASEWLPGCVALLGGAFLLAGAAGCKLFDDYSSIQPAPRCEVGTRTSCPCPGPGDGFQVCTAERRYSACRCGDASYGNGSDVTDGDAAPPSDLSSDAADETYSAQCSAGRVAYPVLETQTTPTIDGNCSDAAYRARIEFSAPSDESPPLNYSDNRGSCWLSWKSGQPAELFGCCEIQDSKPYAATEPGDPLPTIWGMNPDGSNDKVSPDDRVEHLVRSDLESAAGPDDAKYYLNNATDPGPATYAHSYDSSGERGEAFDGVVEAEANRDSAGWQVEWRAELPFSITPPRRGLCEVRVHDVDDGVHGGPMWGFSATGELESPSDWGCCVYRTSE